MGDENPLIYLLGGGSLTLILAAFVKGAWDFIKGRHDRERERAKDRRDTISDLKADLRDAEARAARERSRASTLWEYAATLRQDCICKHGAVSSDLRPWPDLD